MFDKILVAVDGSEPANNAIKAGCELASEQGAQLHLLHVPMAVADAVVLGAASAAIPPSLEQVEKAAKQVMSKSNALAVENGAKNTIDVIEYGQPARIIVEYADKKGIDLIIMGRRGLGTLTGLLIGSVTNKVQQLAPCAVLTVK